MADAKILDMPMEFDLELMAVIRPDSGDAERELFNDVVNKVDRIGLGVLFVTFSARTRVSSSMAVYWNRRTFSPFLSIKVRKLTSIWM